MAEFGLADLIAEMRKVTAASNNPSVIVKQLTGPARRLAMAEDWRERRFFAPSVTAEFANFPLHEEPDHTLSVVVTSLNPRCTLPAHNHKTWALQVGIEGAQVNIRWRRLDDGRRKGYAELDVSGRTEFGPGDVVTFLPDDIHSVANEGHELAVSLNLYGLSYAYTGASTFDTMARMEKPLMPGSPGATGGGAPAAAAPAAAPAAAAPAEPAAAEPAAPAAGGKKKKG
jgi:predicted metal-dependent enzyme (double-stranded beta helix superfamily)